MDACDVLIVGGGPAGSACAWKLRESGLAVTVLDKAGFPRDKVCAGWITPPIVDELQLDTSDYANGRTFQSFARFRVGFIGDENPVDVAYNEPVSFGIRRCEFDDYLLRRSAARLRLGDRAASIRRVGSNWIVNEMFTAPMLVGAAGHWCPVAQMLNGRSDREPVVAAQEIEVALDARQERACAVAADRPELYFCRDLAGYGWAIRKGRFLNVGLGRLHAHALPAARAEFVAFLESRQRIPSGLTWDWHGHAYLLDEPPARRVVGDAVLLAGDAAGLASARSGEGIRPAIESGLMAAATIVEAAGRYTADRLGRYEESLRPADRIGRLSRPLLNALSPRLSTALAPYLVGAPWFARHVLLDRWFLHRH